MAADILLYRADAVPVGEDQKQHVELTRDLAERFNNAFGKTFVVPEPIIRREGARVMSLDDPAKKMSKSAGSENSYIALMDAPDVIRRKIRRAVTDSGAEVRGGPDKPALTNLLDIYSLLSGEPSRRSRRATRARATPTSRPTSAEVVVEALAPDPGADPRARGRQELHARGAQDRRRAGRGDRRAHARQGARARRAGAAAVALAHGVLCSPPAPVAALSSPSRFTMTRTPQRQAARRTPGSGPARGRSIRRRSPAGRTRPRSRAGGRGRRWPARGRRRGSQA